MSLDGASIATSTDAPRAEETTVGVVTAQDSGTPLDAVRSVAQQELRTALGQSTRAGETPLTSAANLTSGGSSSGATTVSAPPTTSLSGKDAAKS